MELLEKILDDASAWDSPLEEIVPVHYGEFFLHPRWYEVLKMIEQKLPQTKIVVPTNGSTLDPEVVSKLLDIKTLHILNISINALFAETYKELMGFEPDTQIKIKEAIKYLSVLRPDINIWVSMVYDPAFQTEKERDLFIKFWSAWATPQTHSTSFCQDYRKPLIEPTIPCRSIFQDFIILWNGIVTPCCWDSDGTLEMGDVNKDSILDIWHGEPMDRLRGFHNDGKRGDIPICSVCTFS